MKQYKMVISDFDGTLFRSDYTVSEKSKDIIQQFVENGGIFVISTGRSPQAILPIARELGLTGVVACFNGAMIVDIQTGKPVFERSHTVQDTVDICKLTEELGVYAIVLDREQYYAKEHNKYLDYYKKATLIDAVLSNKPLSEFVQENSIESVKVNCIVEKEKREMLLTEIDARTEGRFYITSGSRHLVEISPKGFNKGTTVTFLADYYNVPIESIIAVGDSLNDLPMLKTAGLGLAVKNAEPTLKNEVKVYPYTNDENAVARIIEQYALKEIL